MPRLGRVVAVTRTTSSGLTRSLVETLGGRFSSEMGIDVDRGPREVERWFLAATLFGTRISWRIVERTYAVFDANGVRTITDAGARTWDELVALLDEGGYARYDFRTATRLLELSAVVGERYGGRISRLAREEDFPALEADLEALPGWGPVTVRLFLRELRGVWPGARPPLDERVLLSARHLRLPPGRGDPGLGLAELARHASVDARDLEGALVRLGLGHAFAGCPGGTSCRALTARVPSSPAPRPPASRSPSSRAR
jgi:hypothetical protein